MCGQLLGFCSNVLKRLIPSKGSTHCGQEISILLKHYWCLLCICIWDYPCQHYFGKVKMSTAFTAHTLWVLYNYTSMKKTWIFLYRNFLLFKCPITVCFMYVIINISICLCFKIWSTHLRKILLRRITQENYFFGRGISQQPLKAPFKGFFSYEVDRQTTST